LKLPKVTGTLILFMTLWELMNTLSIASDIPDAELAAGRAAEPPLCKRVLGIKASTRIKRRVKL
jgi:hypothetical protein